MPNGGVHIHCIVGFEGLSDLANLFGVDCVVLFMCQLVSHQPKAPIDNPGVYCVMSMVFEGTMNPQFSSLFFFFFESSLDTISFVCCLLQLLCVLNSKRNMNSWVGSE